MTRCRQNPLPRFLERKADEAVARFLQPGWARFWVGKARGTPVSAAQPRKGVLFLARAPSDDFQPQRRVMRGQAAGYEYRVPRGLDRIALYTRLLADGSKPSLPPPCDFLAADVSRLNLPESDQSGLTSAAPNLLAALTAQLAEAPGLVELIARAIVDEPPLAVKEGGMIRDGFSAAILRFTTG